ncbi:unnamed protein product [Moneuplotes crassus]|uniref:Uncharacterized protein n=1 Tax=Euplotes crassus TaxID=5936 RepID=A0AAD2D5Z2_EUPCR|nr:unnamed protein product [Moneuplotes crassus]
MDNARSIEGYHNLPDEEDIEESKVPPYGRVNLTRSSLVPDQNASNSGFEQPQPGMGSSVDSSDSYQDSLGTNHDDNNRADNEVLDGSDSQHQESKEWDQPAENKMSEASNPFPDSEEEAKIKKRRKCNRILRVVYLISSLLMLVFQVVLVINYDQNNRDAS